MEAYHPTRPAGVTAVKVQRARELRREMTPEERILWQELRLFRQRGYAFRRQQVIAGFIADFYCYEARLVVEVDGGIHEQQKEYDTERDNVITRYGLRILRVTNDEVRNHLSDVVARVSAACESSSLGQPSPLTKRGEDEMQQ